jgi:hypothetical protein
VFSIVICFVCMRKMENNQKELRVKFGIFFFFYIYIYIKNMYNNFIKHLFSVS